MSHTMAHSKISELRSRSLIVTMEAIMVLFGAIMAIAILPSLLLRYFYDATTLIEQPKLLEYIPVAAFVVATIYFLKALIGNMRREKMIGQLMAEAEAMHGEGCGSGCCGKGDCGDDCCTDGENGEDEEWDEDLKELETLLAEVEAEDKKPAKKSKASKK